MGKMFITVLCILLSVIVSGQNIYNSELNNKQSILNDRIFFHFPAGAKNVARQVDIMSADRNINQETRIMMDIGSQRLVFFARELYVSSGKKEFF